MHHSQHKYSIKNSKLNLMMLHSHPILTCAKWMDLEVTGAWLARSLRAADCQVSSKWLKDLRCSVIVAMQSDEKFESSNPINTTDRIANFFLKKSKIFFSENLRFLKH